MSLKNVKNGQYKRNLLVWEQNIIETVEIKIKSLLEKINSNPVITAKILVIINQLRTISKTFLINMLSHLLTKLLAMLLSFAGDSMLCAGKWAIVIIKSSNQNTYVSVTMSKTNITNHHQISLKGKLNITVDADNRELPHRYWLLKLHKNPSKFRFIVAATRLSV